jgi:hypothetical protein
MLGIKAVVLEVLNLNKPVAANLHPAMRPQEILDKAIELSQYWVEKEVGLAIGEFYAANGIKLTS